MRMHNGQATQEEKVKMVQKVAGEPADDKKVDSVTVKQNWESTDLTASIDEME